jgi:hypothetical protein
MAEQCGLTGGRAFDADPNSRQATRGLASGGGDKAAIEHWLAIGLLFRRDVHRSAVAARHETDYLYPGRRKVGRSFSNARPNAKPFTLAATPKTTSNNMTEITFKENALEQTIQKLESFVWTDQKKQEIETMRQGFVQTYDNERLNNLTKEDYFAGLGRKQGCLAYDLEWGTKTLGSIKGGSKYKYGYESDFEKIKSLLQKIISIDTSYAYKSDGSISKDLETIVDFSKEINGFKTGRTVIPKLLSIYYPNIFLPIFNDQDRFVEFFLVNGFDTENTGLALYFDYNFKLLNLKNRIEELANKSFGNFEFANLLYHTFPKEFEEAIDGHPIIFPIIQEEHKFEALEVQHYQTLLHRNMPILFPKLKYFDIEQQMQKNGQYDTQVVGIMDMLTQDENGNFVIIEIKRKAKDLSIGQILRYMGWTKEELCKNGQSVRGLIVAESKDINLEFALKVVPGVKFLKLGLSITLVEQ